MQLGLIGNCAYQALIDDQARLMWLCWPRFDSSFVFGALVDEKKGGFFSIEAPGEAPQQSEQSYLPNTNILRTVLTTARGSFEVTDFAPRFRQFGRFYKPTMLVRRLRRIDGEPTIRVRCQPTYDYGRYVPDCEVASNHIQWRIPGQALRLTTHLPLNYIREERPFLLEHEAWLVLTWGEPLESPLFETCTSFFKRTQRYWERWVKHTSMPGRYQREVVRSALALKLHQYEDTGAITAATTTSLPEYPGSGRNWDYRFCWLRDSYFTLRAMRRLGHFEELEAFVSFLKNIASTHESLQPVYGITGETRIDEEILTHLSGANGDGPVRAGNAAYQQVQFDVYGEMIAAIAPLFIDFRFDEHLTPNTVGLLRRLLHRITQTIDQPDAGIWEIRDTGRVHTFSLLFHWFGARIAERIGKQIGDNDLHQQGRALAAQASHLLETRCFHPTLGFYGDSTTTANADAAMLMLINLGYLSAEHPHAESHLRALERELLVNGHLMQRYKHHDGLGDTHATFTMCGFWYVEALARLGHKDEAREAFEKLLTYRNHLGLLSEDVDPATGQQLGNFPQTYSHVGIINAAFVLDPFPNEIGD